MKKVFILSLSLIFVIAAIAQEHLVTTPAKPQPGALVTIKYNPKNTEMSGVKDFEAFVFLLEGKMPLAKEISLKEENGSFTGTFKTNDTTRAFFIVFVKDEVRDNNNDIGYFSPLYDKAGNEVAGASLALASGFGSYSGIWGLKKNADLTKELNIKEFSKPGAKTKFQSEYISFLAQSSEESDKDLLKKELESLLVKKGITEGEMQRVKSIYENSLKDKEKGNAILASLKAKFPNGAWKRSEQIAAFNKEPDVDKKEKLYNDILAQFPPKNKEDEQVINNISRALAQKFADSSRFEKMELYASKIGDRSTLANFYNNLAWKMAGAGITKEPINVSLGKTYSEKAMQLMKEEIKAPGSKPTYLTDEQWKKNLEYTYHNFLNTYATLLYHDKDVAKAYEMQTKVVNHFKRKNMSMNETYALLTEKVKGDKEAIEELENFIADGKNTPAMKDQLKALYLKNNSEEQWVKHIDHIETVAFNKLKAEVAKKMIHMPAPQFKLKDLTGSEVSLASLKGKVVVVDFWATWCGPCIASFPGMQKAVDKYKNHPDVAFVFIDTWEGGDDREKKVSSFIEKNKYTFNVLYDDAKAENPNDFVVVSDYKVDGIPTKFVVDKDSNIRFKSVGYHGSVDGLVSELTAMIEMAKEGSGSGGENKTKKVL